MKRLKNTIYGLGVFISFLAMAGFAESITGRGSRTASIVMFIIGFLCALVGYV